MNWKNVSKIKSDSEIQWLLSFPAQGPVGQTVSEATDFILSIDLLELTFLINIFY